MCRSKDENNSRRCECDSSENRRLRRYNAAARAKFAAAAVPATPVSQVIFPSSYFADGSYSPETVERKVKDLLVNLPKLLLEGDAWIQHVLIEGKEISHSARAVEFDKIVSILGEGVEFIARERYGAPTNDKFTEAESDLDNEYSIKYYEKYDEALENGMDKDQAESHVEDVLMDWYQNEKVNRIGDILDKRNEALQNSLKDIGVVFANPNDTYGFEYSKDSDVSAIDSLKVALKFYPQNWVYNSNQQNWSSPLKVIQGKDRAYYAESIPIENGGSVFLQDYSELYVSLDEYSYFREDAGMRVALHEFGHRIEHVIGSVPFGGSHAGGISTAEKVFLSRRTGRNRIIGVGDNNEGGEQLTTIEIEGEVGYKDTFPSHYMGRAYDEYSDPNFNWSQYDSERFPRTEAWEVFTMGMETLFAGTNGAFVGIDKTNTRPNYEEADTDYKRFILGLLASSARPDSQK